MTDSAHELGIPGAPAAPRVLTDADGLPTTLAPRAMGKGRRKWVIAAVIGVVVLGAIGGRTWWKSKHAAPSAAARADVPHLEGAAIRYSVEFRKRAGIKTAPAQQSEIVPTVSVTGTVKFDPKLVAAIGARIPGRIRKILHVPGDLVKVGEALAEIESVELGRAQSATLSARAHAQAATANEKRERQLADAKVSSEREAELAHANAEAARAELYAAEQAVRALGGDGVNSAAGVLTLRSPIAGKVVESGVFLGQSLEPTHTAFRVADLTHLWVELAVFERELPVIRAGDRVELSPQTNPAAAESGKVAYVGDVIDTDTRSASVRIEVENANGHLRPGQAVLAKIHTSSPAKNVLNVPVSAVTRVDGKPTVFVAHGDTQVEARAVELGLSDSSRVQIVAGVKDGEIVVVEGVFALKSELFR